MEAAGQPVLIFLFLPQVSTHARLLNQKDLEALRKTLKLPDTIHCLFLSQFDTEHAFRQDLRWALLFLFFKLTGDFHLSQCFGVRPFWEKVLKRLFCCRSFFREPQEVRLLLVQFHFDEPQSSKRLLACAK